MAARRDGTQSYVIGLAALTVAVFVILGLLRPGFFSAANLSSMGFQFPEFGLLALAVFLPMVSGGIDLSVVGVANLAAIVAAVMMREGGMLAVLAVPAALLIGLAAGALNAFLISVLRLPAILATLGTMQLFAGLGIVITGGPAITGLPGWYNGLGNATLFGVVPLPFIAFCVVAVLLGVFYRATPAGIRIRLYGTNPVAARFAGMRERRLTFQTYMIAGFVASLAGLVVLARVNSASSDYGASYLLLVILINILAGVSATGGFGTVGGVVVAVLLLQLISSGLNFLAFSAFARDLFFGGLLVVAMSVRALAEGVRLPNPFRPRTRTA
jgi:simple sugar transport system permease protein